MVKYRASYGTTHTRLFCLAFSILNLYYSSLTLKETFFLLALIMRHAFVDFKYLKTSISWQPEKCCYYSLYLMVAGKCCLNILIPSTCGPTGVQHVEQSGKLLLALHLRFRVGQHDPGLRGDQGRPGQLTAKFLKFHSKFLAHIPTPYNWLADTYTQEKIIQQPSQNWILFLT